MEGSAANSPAREFKNNKKNPKGTERRDAWFRDPDGNILALTQEFTSS